MDPAGASVASDIGGGEGEKFTIGNIYSVKVITGDEFRGIVMAYDPIPNFVFFDILSLLPLSFLICFFYCFHKNLRFRDFDLSLTKNWIFTRGFET